MESNDTESPATLADFALLKEDSNVFVDAAVAVREYFVLTGDGEPAHVRALSVSHNYFELWGTGAVLGRGFADGEDLPGAPPVTVLNHGFWSRHYGEDPNVVGDEILLNGQPYTIIGVLSPKMGFGFLSRIDLWVGLREDPATAPRERKALISVRVDPEVPFDRARDEAAAVGAKLAEIYPETHRGWSLRVQSVSEALLGESDRHLVAILFATVGLVLLIACANVANMVMARATTRSKEVAVRVALGASRLRLVRQLLVESFLLSALAAGLGLLLTQGLLDLLVLITNGEHLLFQTADIDGQVLAYTLAITVATPLIFALLPSLRASRPDLGGMLKDGSRSGDGRVALGARGVLVVAQVGMALLMMVLIGLLVRNLSEMRRIDLGIDLEGILSAQLNLPESKYEDGAALTQFYDALIERLEATPGIRAAAAVNEIPLIGFGARRTLSVEGGPVNEETAPTAHFLPVRPAISPPWASRWSAGGSPKLEIRARPNPSLSSTKQRPSASGLEEARSDHG
ncbi:MAG: FtsX-like permease family protein [Acidobacteria bacterium]|nr:MAG: FtsX-like permease family protein [Acidobacteriota bacterium]